MEKGRVGNKRKRNVKAVVKKSPEKAKYAMGWQSTKKTVVCDRCKSEAVLVKVIGNHEVYKCTKCNRTTERWT